MGRCVDMFLHRHGTAQIIPDHFLPERPDIFWFQAKNIVNYLRIIHRILAPGGIWINLGKLPS
jgi:hypothetical protein